MCEECSYWRTNIRSHPPLKAVKLALLVVVVLLGAPILHAQVPLVSIDLLAGVAAHNNSDGANEFEHGLVPKIRLATTIRLGSSATTRPVLRLEFEPRPLENGSFGKPAPYPYPSTGGVSVGLGVVYVASPTTTLGLAVGGGRYGGAYRGWRHNSVFGEAELARRVLGHASLLANVQYRQWFDDGARFWIAPITVGLRLF